MLLFVLFFLWVYIISYDIFCCLCCRFLPRPAVTMESESETKMMASHGSNQPSSESQKVPTPSGSPGRQAAAEDSASLLSRCYCDSSSRYFLRLGTQSHRLLLNNYTFWNSFLFRDAFLMSSSVKLITGGNATGPIGV